MTELGAKYKCYKCGCKFYDLGKPEALCPQCGEDQSNEESKKLLKRKRRRSLAKSKADVRPAEESMTGSEVEDELDEYVLDMDDVVMEEKEEQAEEEEEA